MRWVSNESAKITNNNFSWSCTSSSHGLPFDHNVFLAKPQQKKNNNKQCKYTCASSSPFMHIRFITIARRERRGGDDTKCAQPRKIVCISAKCRFRSTFDYGVEVRATKLGSCVMVSLLFFLFRIIKRHSKIVHANWNSRLEPKLINAKFNKGGAWGTRGID